jgi:hypothetical protein
VPASTAKARAASTSKARAASNSDTAVGEITHKSPRWWKVQRQSSAHCWRGPECRGWEDGLVDEAARIKEIKMRYFTRRQVVFRARDGTAGRYSFEYMPAMCNECNGYYLEKIRVNDDAPGLLSDLFTEWERDDSDLKRPDPNLDWDMDVYTLRDKVRRAAQAKA